MTFNDLEGQNHIVYSAIPPNISMHAINQVNWCSGKIGHFDYGGGGVKNTQKYDYVICERSLN